MPSSTEQEATKHKGNKRFAPVAYARVGVLTSCYWSVKDKEIYDREMEQHRQYLIDLYAAKNKRVNCSKSPQNEKKNKTKKCGHNRVE